LTEHAASVVDIGCGQNQMIVELRERGMVKATGVDFACPLADELCDITVKTKFKDDEFDVLTSFDMMEHLHPDDVDGAIEEMKRISKRFVMTISSRASNALGMKGEQLHLIMKPSEWWHNKLLDHAVDVERFNGFFTGCWDNEKGIERPVIKKSKAGKQSA
jgi:ubiquinone/menaquinone biosynthesis C-methylase UbiE